MTVKPQDKNKAMFNIFNKYKKEPWLSEIKNYIYGNYDSLAYRVNTTFSYVAPDPIINRFTYSTEFSNIINEAGKIFDSTMSELIEKTGSPHDHKIHGFLKFLRDFDPYLEERPVLFTRRNLHRYIFPFERSKHDDLQPIWWIVYNDLKHLEVSNYRFGNFENALTSVAAIAILSGYIQPRGGAVIFANTGIINTNMKMLFPITPRAV